MGRGRCGPGVETIASRRGVSLRAPQCRPEPASRTTAKSEWFKKEPRTDRDGDIERATKTFAPAEAPATSTSLSAPVRAGCPAAAVSTQRTPKVRYQDAYCVKSHEQVQIGTQERGCGTERTLAILEFLAKISLGAGKSMQKIKMV